jgi:hypothetical protein
MIRSLSLLFARRSCLVKLDFYNANSLIPNSMSRHITPLVNIIQTLSQLVFTRVQRRNKNQFYCSWFESTGDCTHNHHCCCFLSVDTMFYFYMIDPSYILHNDHWQRIKVMIDFGILALPIFKQMRSPKVPHFHL